jgi:hypothetical protein
MLTKRDQQYIESEVQRIGKYLQQEAGPGMGKFSEITEHVYISNWAGACNPDYLKDKDIELVICASKDRKTKEELSLYNTMRIQQTYIPISDNQNDNITRFFEHFYELLYDSILEEKHILVHCETGASSSVAMVLYYLLKRYYLTNFGKKAALDQELMSARSFKLKEILTYIKGRRTCVDPNLGFITQLLTAEMFLKKQMTAIYESKLAEEKKKELQREKKDANERVKSREKKEKKEKKVTFIDDLDDVEELSFDSTE